MHLGQIAEGTPGKPAVIMASDGGTTSYAELDQRSTKVARFLRAHGIGRGDHIAILMDNRPEFLEVAWAAQRSGVYYTPVNWHLTEAEAAYVVQDRGARGLFTSASLASVAAHVRASSPGLVVAVMAGGARAGFPDYEGEAAREAGGAAG